MSNATTLVLSLLAQGAQTKCIRNTLVSLVLDYIFKLVGMKNTILNIIKLELPSNHFLNELTKHIKQKNRPESLGGIISRLT